MKRYFLVLMAAVFLIFPMAVQAGIYNLSLPSGTTVEPSGTSPMAVSGAASGRTVINIDEDVVAGTTAFIQVPTISGVSVSQSERVSGGDNSGVTLLVKKKESMIDSTDAWDAAQAITVFSVESSGASVFSLGSGVSLQQRPFIVESNGLIKFYITSGITRLGVANFIVKIPRTR